jgi:hypothetical protein
MACYCISVRCEIFDCLALCLGVQPAEVEPRGLWPGDASLAMKDLHNDARVPSGLGSGGGVVGKHVVWL